jgi:hypothetical protein
MWWIAGFILWTAACGMVLLLVQSGDNNEEDDVWDFDPQDRLPGTSPWPGHDHDR